MTNSLPFPLQTTDGEGGDGRGGGGGLDHKITELKASPLQSQKDDKVSTNLKYKFSRSFERYVRKMMGDRGWGEGGKGMEGGGCCWEGGGGAASL